jgi:hypothetical protein
LEDKVNGTYYVKGMTVKETAWGWILALLLLIVWFIEGSVVIYLIILP